MEMNWHWAQDGKNVAQQRDLIEHQHEPLSLVGWRDLKGTSAKYLPCHGSRCWSRALYRKRTSASNDTERPGSHKLTSKTVLWTENFVLIYVVDRMSFILHVGGKRDHGAPPFHKKYLYWFPVTTHLFIIYRLTLCALLSLWCFISRQWRRERRGSLATGRRATKNYITKNPLLGTRLTDRWTDDFSLLFMFWHGSVIFWRADRHDDGWWRPHHLIPTQPWKPLSIILLLLRIVV